VVRGEEVRSFERLEVEHRGEIDKIHRILGLDTFYHYFPLLYAISKSVAEIKIATDEMGNIIGVYVGEDMYYLWDVPDRNAKRIWIATQPSVAERGFRTEIYDVNYIYDLDVTLNVKNFRDNVKRFLREHEPVYEECSVGDAFKVVVEWYERGKRKEYSDFGYTLWLAENFDVFDDLRARCVYLDGEPRAFTLWGIIDWGPLRPLGVHLICKDLGIPFLQDYTRYATYREMRGLGIKYVNDGGDAGVEGIRTYKLKLRPYLVIPIYSWVRDEEVG